jgi:hypothetical protein
MAGVPLVAEDGLLVFVFESVGVAEELGEVLGWPIIAAMCAIPAMPPNPMAGVMRSSRSRRLR